MKKGFTDIMFAIIIGALLIFGALVFFAVEINNMTRSINLIMREYEIELASNEYIATKRGIETATLLGGANSVFDMGLLGFGDYKQLSNDDTSISPTVWYLNHTPPKLYLFKGWPKEYRYVPTKSDIEMKLGAVLDEYFNETNKKLNTFHYHRILLPGLNIIEIRLRNLGAGDVKIEQVPDYGTISIQTISPNLVPNAETNVPAKKGNYVYIPYDRSNVYGKSFYMPKCYIFGGTCIPNTHPNPDTTIMNELKCDDVTCGCPTGQICSGVQGCKFSCPLNMSKEISMTSGFGCRRLKSSSPVEFHPGVDLVYSDNSNEIYAPAKGILYDAYSESQSGGYGNMLVLTHGCVDSSDNSPHIYFTIYGHLYSFSTKLDWKIEKGELIGYMGSTGISTGKHLHYEVRENENKEIDGVLEVWRPNFGSNLVNPCDLSGGSICGNCDCKSECALQGYSCENWNSYSCSVCSGCSVSNDQESCSGGSP